MAQSHLGIQNLPERVLKRAQQIFNKYDPEEVRKMGSEFIHMYNKLSKAEKPMDISQTVPFVNTEDIAEQNQIGQNDNKLFLIGKQVDLDKIEEQLENKKNFKYQQQQIDMHQKWKLIASNQEPEPDQQSDKNLDKEKMYENDDIVSKKQKSRLTYNKSVILYTQNAAIAYLLKKMPFTFGVGVRVLSEIKYRMPNFKPETFLDFGAGLGSGSWAYYDLFPESAKNIVAIEPSKVMNKMGTFISKDMGNKIIWLESLAQTVALSYGFTFDIVYMQNVLEEVPSGEQRLLIIDSLWQKVKEGGIFIYIEPGTPKGARFSNDFRNYMIKKYGSSARLIAPCPHMQVCPLAGKKTSWCHFEQMSNKYPKRIFPKKPIERPQDNEKFTFMVFQKINNKMSFPQDLDSAKTPAEKSFFWDRIVFPRMKRGGHIIVDLCTKEGKFERRIIGKSHGVQGGYKELQNLKWGDLWRFQKRIPNKYRKDHHRGKRIF